MRLEVNRKWFTAQSVCGELSIDGAFFCYTLEPPIRVEKPHSIPAGTYNIAIQSSQRFQTNTPHVLNVPDFDGIEIHPGNYPHDTHGCCLVGETHTADFIGNSRPLFAQLMQKLMTDPEHLSITYAGGSEAA
jgi:hypothetical protein